MLPRSQRKHSWVHWGARNWSHKHKIWKHSWS